MQLIHFNDSFTHVDPSATPARPFLRGGRLLIKCMFLAGEWAEMVALCLNYPEFWPDECLIFIIIETLYSSVSAATCLSRSLWRVLKAFYKKCISFPIFGLTSILVNFRYKYTAGWCFITQKQKQDEHLSSVRKHPSMIDALWSTDTSDLDKPFLRRRRCPFSVSKYSKTSRHSCPQEKLWLCLS